MVPLRLRESRRLFQHMWDFSLRQRPPGAARRTVNPHAWHKKVRRLQSVANQHALLSTSIRRDIRHAFANHSTLTRASTWVTLG